MVELLALVFLLSLALWRVTSLLFCEQPFDWLRRWLGIDQIGDDWMDWVYPANLVGALWGCFWCLSLILGIIVPMVGVLLGCFEVLEGLLIWLASATGAIMVEKWIGRSKARL